MNQNKRNSDFDLPVANFVTVTLASRLLNVSAKTIRRWEECGLISATRNQYNHRLFSLSQLRSIQHQKYQPLPPTGKANQQELTISQAAKTLGISIKTLRRWEQSGKVRCRRNQKNQRVFDSTLIASIKEQQSLVAQKPAFIHRAAYWYSSLTALTILASIGLVTLGLLIVYSTGLSSQSNSTVYLSNSNVINKQVAKFNNLTAPPPNHLALANSYDPYNFSKQTNFNVILPNNNEIIDTLTPPITPPLPSSTPISPSNLPNSLPLNSNINQFNTFQNDVSETTIYNAGNR